VEASRDRDRVVRGETTRAVELEAVETVHVDELDVDRTGQEEARRQRRGVVVRVRDGDRVDAAAVVVEQGVEEEAARAVEAVRARRQGETRECHTREGEGRNLGHGCFSGEVTWEDSGT